MEKIILNSISIRDTVDIRCGSIIFGTSADVVYWGALLR